MSLYSDLNMMIYMNATQLCDTERHAKKNNEIARKGPETCGRQACEIRQCQVADVGIE